jgi:hypothetical protein
VGHEERKVEWVVRVEKVCGELEELEQERKVQEEEVEQQ